METAKIALVLGLIAGVILAAVNYLMSLVTGRDLSGGEMAIDVVAGAVIGFIAVAVVRRQERVRNRGNE